MAESEFFRTEIKEIIIYIFFGILLFVILPFVGGFILGGFEEEILSGRPFSISISSYLGGFIIYFFMMIGALAVIIYPIGRMIAIKRNEHPASQNKTSSFTPFTISLIHSPEENGALYRLFHYLGFKNNPMRFTLSIFRIFILSILIFGLLGIIQLSYPQLNIASVPNVAQQITTSSDIIFNAGVPSFTENGILLFLFCLLLGFNALICSKFRLGLVGFFLIAYIFICPFMGLTWMQMHSIVYGNEEAKLLATFIFGWVGSMITLTFATFLPWLVWHFMNNLFIKLSALATFKEDVYFIAILVWSILFILYFVAEFLIYRYKKNKNTRVVVPE